MSCERYRPGDELWREGQPADELFIVEQGRLVVEQRVMQPGVGGEPPAAAAVAAAAAAAAAAGGCYARGDGLPAAGSSGGRWERPPAAIGGGGGGGGGGGVRVFEFGPGSIAGVVDFYLCRPRSSSASVASLGAAGGGGGAGGSGACRVLRLTRDALGRMAAEAPAALHILQVLRPSCGGRAPSLKARGSGVL